MTGCIQSRAHQATSSLPSWPGSDSCSQHWLLALWASSRGLSKPRLFWFSLYSVCSLLLCFSLCFICLLVSSVVYVLLSFYSSLSLHLSRFASLCLFFLGLPLSDFMWVSVSLTSWALSGLPLCLFLFLPHACISLCISHSVPSLPIASRSINTYTTL